MRYLFISDLQIPFHLPDALKFCVAVQKEFKIPSNHIYCVGDEIDQYWGGLWEKDPDALHTINSELYEAKQELLRWYRAFPEMKLAVSNHGLRWAKRAFKAGIPRVYMRAYTEFMQAPKGWQWRESWQLDGVLFIHGDGFSGKDGAIKAAQGHRKSVVVGHIHSFAGVQFVAGSHDQSALHPA